MNDLTKQMLDDFRYYLEEDKWADLACVVKENLELVGIGAQIVYVKEIYDNSGKNLLRRIYQRQRDVGTDYGAHYLDAASASEQNLDLLLANAK